MCYKILNTHLLDDVAKKIPVRGERICGTSAGKDKWGTRNRVAKIDGQKEWKDGGNSLHQIELKESCKYTTAKLSYMQYVSSHVMSWMYILWIRFSSQTKVYSQCTISN